MAARRLPILTRKGAIRLGALAAVLAILALGAWSCMIRMPGKSFSGALPPLSPGEEALAASLRKDVAELGGRIGIRNSMALPALEEAADFMESRLASNGLPVKRESYEARGNRFHNVVLEIPGSSQVVVVGAHYDSVIGCPGANDNGTGSAALLALAARFAKVRPSRTLRFVAFPNEEPPHFQTMEMGSRQYARGCRERKDDVVAMVSLETLGWYSDEEGTQQYPAPLSLFYPSQGNFLAFVGNVSSGTLVRRAIGVFREKARFPSEGAALPGWLPGVAWSDHWSFWEEGYEAIMVTDTAAFRYPHYHLPSDTPEKVDYGRFARVVSGLAEVIADLTGAAPPPLPGP